MSYLKHNLIIVAFWFRKFSKFVKTLGKIVISENKHNGTITFGLLLVNNQLLLLSYK